jgi:DnaK suppressor protein
MDEKIVLEFKEILIEKRDNILKNIQKCETEIDLMRGQSPTDEGDYAVLTNEASIDNSLIEKQLQELEEIELSLDKISKGTFGICEMCEEPIGLERLKVKPFARFCITCREINEQENGLK